MSFSIDSVIPSKQHSLTPACFKFSWLLRNVSIAVLLAVYTSGCGKAVPDYAEDLVAVSGTVTLDGDPVEGAVVSFVAQDGPSRLSAATTNAEGKFSMETTQAGDGVLPGDYAIVISKLTMADGSAVPPDVAPMDVGAEEQLPEKYSSFAVPTLSAKVTASGGEFPFELTSK